MGLGLGLFALALVTTLVSLGDFGNPISLGARDASRADAWDNAVGTSASEARLARMASEVERVAEAAQDATTNGLMQPGYSDVLMRRAEHAKDQLQMAKIENKLEGSKGQLTELAAKYPDNEKVAYVLDAITIAEDAAEVPAPSDVCFSSS